MQMNCLSTILSRKSYSHLFLVQSDKSPVILVVESRVDGPDLNFTAIFQAKGVVSVHPGLVDQRRGKNVFLGLFAFQCLWLWLRLRGRFDCALEAIDPCESLRIDAW